MAMPAGSVTFSKMAALQSFPTRRGGRLWGIRRGSAKQLRGKAARWPQEECHPVFHGDTARTSRGGALPRDDQGRAIAETSTGTARLPCCLRRGNFLTRRAACAAKRFFRFRFVGQHQWDWAEVSCSRHSARVAGHRRRRRRLRAARAPNLSALANDSEAPRAQLIASASVLATNSSRMYWSVTSQFTFRRILVGKRMCPDICRNLRSSA